jgi:hypothetical protein
MPKVGSAMFLRVRGGIDSSKGLRLLFLSAVPGSRINLDGRVALHF